MLLKRWSVSQCDRQAQCDNNIIADIIVSENDFISSSVTDEHHFRNDNMLLYQFTVGYGSKSSLSDVLKYNIGIDRRDSADSRSSTDHADENSHPIHERRTASGN